MFFNLFHVGLEVKLKQIKARKILKYVAEQREIERECAQRQSNERQSVV